MITMYGFLRIGVFSMSFYKALVFIHVISAIVGLGPGFILTLIIMNTKNMTEVRHAFSLWNRIHIFVMLGGIMLLVTGLLMGFLNPSLFKQGWYIVSLLLFLVTLVSGPFVLKPISIPIQEILAEYDGEEIPEDYLKHANRLFLS